MPDSTIAVGSTKGVSVAAPVRVGEGVGVGVSDITRGCVVVAVSVHVRVGGLV